MARPFARISFHIQQHTPLFDRIYAPYYLFFGHSPRLPIDNLLTPVLESKSPDVQQYVELHRQRMQQALKRANGHLKKKAEVRRQRHNNQSSLQSLTLVKPSY